MGRTFRRNLKKELAHPYLVYLLRKWHSKVESEKVVEKKEEPSTSWADWDDDDDDQELPPLPSEWDAYASSPWKIKPEPKSKKIIKFTPEYIYKNS